VAQLNTAFKKRRSYSITRLRTGLRTKLPRPGARRTVSWSCPSLSIGAGRSRVCCSTLAPNRCWTSSIGVLTLGCAFRPVPERFRNRPSHRAVLRGSLRAPPLTVPRPERRQANDALHDQRFLLLSGQPRRDGQRQKDGRFVRRVVKLPPAVPTKGTGKRVRRAAEYRAQGKAIPKSFLTRAQRRRGECAA